MTDPFTPDSAPRWKRRSKLSSAAQAPQHAHDCYSSPEWQRLRATIMKALQNFPEARESVVTALRTLNAKDPDGPAS